MLVPRIKSSRSVERACKYFLTGIKRTLVLFFRQLLRFAAILTVTPRQIGPLIMYTLPFWDLVSHFFLRENDPATPSPCSRESWQSGQGKKI